jgi:hypothetical protein
MRRAERGTVSTTEKGDLMRRIMLMTGISSFVLLATAGEAFARFVHG